MKKYCRLWTCGLVDDGNVPASWFGFMLAAHSIAIYDDYGTSHKLNSPSRADIFHLPRVMIFLLAKYTVSHQKRVQSDTGLQSLHRLNCVFGLQRWFKQHNILQNTFKPISIFCFKFLKNTK